MKLFFNLDNGPENHSRSTLFMTNYFFSDCLISRSPDKLHIMVYSEQ